MAFKQFKAMGDRSRNSSLISLSSRISLLFFLLSSALKDEVIRVVAFVPNQRVHLDLDSTSHRDVYYARPTGQKIRFAREHCATTLSTSKENRTVRLSSIPRTMELWLDAREGIEGWEKFQGSADRVLFDDGRERSRESCSNTVKQLLVKDDGKLMDQSEQVVGLSMIVASPRDQSRALALVGSVEWIQVTCSDWTMIPAENLVSAAGSTPTKIAVEISEPSQVQGAAFALQLGVDALLLRPHPDLWTAGVAAREQRNAAARPPEPSPQLSGPDSLQESSNSGEQGGGRASIPEEGKEMVLLSSALVTGAKEAGVGDRVCVDLIQNLGEGEGMLLGSSAKTLALVHAETFETGFVPARPFRVNAGPVHSYALMADGSTKYLSELKAGDQVLVVDHSGSSRAVTIGRLKVEARPMMMIQFECDSTTKGHIFLQQAETVRLIQPSRSDDSEGRERRWEPLPVTDVIGGEQILVREVRRGTHIGKPIEAVVVES